MAEATRQRRSQGQPSNKIKKYRKPLNLNIGMIIFAVILIYVIICVILYFQKGYMVRYEVQSGSLATNNIYRGMVIRDERVVNTTSAGYVNYYANEGERVAANDLVYIVDETGRLSEELENANLGENVLSDRELSEFKNELVNFSHGFDREDYIGVYDFKNSLHNTVQKLANNNMLENIEKIGASSGSSSVIERCCAPVTGVISYWVDGYESITSSDVTEEMFDKTAYEERKKLLLGNTLLERGSPAYKLSLNEKWSIVIPVDSVEHGAEMEEEGYIKVRFLKNQYESWGAVKLLNNGDGKHYIELSFTNSMITFVNDRFLDVELLMDDRKGLKIPNSAIVTVPCYLIPEEFVIEEGNTGKGQVLKQYVTEKNEVSSRIYDVSIYNYDEKQKVYYMDTVFLNTEDTLLIEGDPEKRYVVSKMAEVTGVYNVNNGYADFKRINILAQNNEYAIVESGTRYGLNVYDYIALNADSVHADQFITE